MNTPFDFELFDIGVNLTAATYRSDRDLVVQRARECGVTRMLLIGSDLQDSQAAIDLAANYPGCYATAGVHPHHADDFDSNTPDQIVALSRNDSVKAIGETGLDFNRNYSTRENQIAAFVAQLELGARTQLPLYLHQRDAHDVFLQLLKEHRDSLSRAVVHCFTDTRDQLFDYLDLDLHIGITGWICDERRGSHLHPLVAEIPDNRLMLETDAPYLLPRTIDPKPKTRRNEPAYLRYVLKTVAACLGQDEASVAAATTETARKFFGLDSTD